MNGLVLQQRGVRNFSCMRYASIDIGTNTILLLIAETSSAGIKKILLDTQVTARLGKGVDANRIILPETFERIKNFLVKYKQICNEYKVEKILSVGTSALRDAINKNEFCNYIKTEVGLDIEILDGDTEAEWTFRGGISDFLYRSDNFLVVDIGGGSTELALGNSISVTSKISCDIGSVRITERFLKRSPPLDSEIKSANEYIISTLKNNNIAQLEGKYAIGVSGTFTTLACLNKRMPMFEPEKTSGHILMYENIAAIFSELKNKSVEEIKSYPQITEGRYDIILAGIMILKNFMEIFPVRTIAVSTKGLRYGIIFRELRR